MLLPLKIPNTMYIIFDIEFIRTINIISPLIAEIYRPKFRIKSNLINYFGIFLSFKCFDYLLLTYYAKKYVVVEGLF